MRTLVKPALISASLIAVVVMSGCTEQFVSDNRFVGSWRGTSNVMAPPFTCFSDGSFISGYLTSFVESGEWNIKYGKFVVYSDYGMASYSYSFSEDGNTLVLTNTNNGISITYEKQSNM